MCLFSDNIFREKTYVCLEINLRYNSRNLRWRCIRVYLYVCSLLWIALVTFYVPLWHPNTSLSQLYSESIALPLLLLNNSARKFEIAYHELLISPADINRYRNYDRNSKLDRHEYRWNNYQHLWVDQNSSHWIEIGIRNSLLGICNARETIQRVNA